MKPKKKHGGKRPGAGRKHLCGEMLRAVTVKIPESDLARLGEKPAERIRELLRAAR